MDIAGGTVDGTWRCMQLPRRGTFSQAQSWEKRSALSPKVDDKKRNIFLMLVHRFFGFKDFMAMNRQPHFWEEYKNHKTR